METNLVILKLEEILHPAIDFSLIKLNILTEIQVESDVLSVVFAFPFANIPIAQQLISSVADKAEELKLGFNYSTRVMKEEERDRFLELEQEAWKGL